MVIFLSILGMLLIAALFVSLNFNLRFGNMLVNIEDNLQECIDRIDERYQNLMHVFDESPGVMSDDPFVRSFLNEVSLAREDLLIIANILARGSEPMDEIISEDDDTLAPGDDPDVVQSEKE
jgi:hypothetical protein